MRTPAVLVVLAVALATSACTPDAPTATKVGGVHVVDRSAMLAEYRGLAGDYPWPLPEGVAFPTTLPPPQEPTMYQVGEGENQADSFWICAWIGEWARADTAGDSGAAAWAWAWVERADETQLHREHYDDPRDVWHREILAPARAGHPQALREFYSTSCGFAGLATLR